MAAFSAAPKGTCLAGPKASISHVIPSFALLHLLFMLVLLEWIVQVIERVFLWLSMRTAARTLASPSREPSGSSLGRVIESGEPFTLAARDLARHAYLLGSTGCGKTSLILKLLERDIEEGHTVAVVDLRGDLVTGVLGLCERMDIEPERVTVLDLRERERVQGFNPLAGAGEPYIRALHLLDVVAGEAESWGVQLEETLRNALLLLSLAGRRLTDLDALFFEGAFRASLLACVCDESLLGFWERYGKLSSEKQQTFALPVLNKVTSLTAVPALRQVLGRAESLDLGALLGKPGQIFLVSLAVDELQRSSRMLGSLIVSAISREMMARVNVPERERNPVRLYVDEFENMASESFEGLIAEGRRFGLTLVLSHQTLSQLPARLRSVVRNNVGLQMLFQCGFEDAMSLNRELPKDLDLEDGLRSLSVGEAVVMRRDGTAEVVKFAAPAKPPSSEAIDTYRQSVLSRLPVPAAPGPMKAPQNGKPKKTKKQTEALEEWL
jgi:hypothetical protein